MYTHFLRSANCNCIVQVTSYNPQSRAAVCGDSWELSFLSLGKTVIHLLYRPPRGCIFCCHLKEEKKY